MSCPNNVIRYNAGDIKALVEYARVRGVQVLLEVDMPGHNYAFGIGYPELINNCTAMCTDLDMC